MRKALLAFLFLLSMTLAAQRPGIRVVLVEASEFGTPVDRVSLVWRIEDRDAIPVKVLFERRISYDIDQGEALPAFRARVRAQEIRLRNERLKEIRLREEAAQDARTAYQQLER